MQTWAPLMHSTHPQKMKQIFLNFMIIVSNSFQTQKPLSTITDDRSTLFVRLLRCMFTLHLFHVSDILKVELLKQNMSIFECRCFGREICLVCPRCECEGLLLAFLPVPWDIWQGIYSALSLCWRWKWIQVLLSEKQIPHSMPCSDFYT